MPEFRIHQYKSNYVLIPPVSTRRRELDIRRTWDSDVDVRAILPSALDISPRERFSTQLLSGALEFFYRKDAHRYRSWLYGLGIMYDNFYIMPYTRDIQYEDNITFLFPGSSYNTVLTYPVGLDASFEYKYLDSEGGTPQGVKYNNGYGVLLCIYNELDGTSVIARIIGATTSTINGILYNHLDVWLMWDPLVFTSGLPITWFKRNITISALPYGSVIELSEKYNSEFDVTDFQFSFEEWDEYPVILSTSSPGDGFVSDTTPLLRYRKPGQFSSLGDPGVGTPSRIAPGLYPSLIDLSGSNLSPVILSPGRDSSGVTLGDIEVLSPAPGVNLDVLAVASIPTLVATAPGLNLDVLSLSSLYVSEDLAPGLDSDGISTSNLSVSSNIAPGSNWNVALQGLTWSCNGLTVDTLAPGLDLTPATDLFANTVVGNYTAECSEGSTGDPVTVSVAIGTIYASTLALANATAQSMAQSQAETGLVCVSYTPPLSLISTEPEMCFSCYRQLVLDYEGPLILVRRSSDNATLAIGHINGYLDEDSLSAFCVGTNGFVQVGYDQGALGQDLSNTLDPGQQPQIYDATTGIIRDPVTNYVAMLFDHDGSGFDGIYLRSSSAIASDPNITRYLKYRPAVGASANRYVLGHSGSSSETRLLTEASGTGGEVAFNGGKNVVETFNLNDSDTLYTIFLEYNNTSEIVQIYSGATNVSENSPTAAVGSRSWAAMKLGGPPNDNQSSAYLGYIQECAVFYGLLDSDERITLI